MKLKHKMALITGGAKGIGKAIAQRFMQEGASVIIFDVIKPDFDAEYHAVDVSNEDQIDNAIKKIPTLDIVVNNAGIYFFASVQDTTKEQLDAVIDINLKGPFLICKYTLPLLKQSHGTVINIASGLGIIPEPESPAYCATKAGVIMLTKCMSQEYGKNGVRVNAILPGPIDTDLLRGAFNTTEELETYADKNPLRRLGKPEDVANVAAFLASDEAGYVNGGMYSVDGGETASSVYSK
jgi:NAD(P)-dependent dehydrogenase (short-subunit alcohol dehydrogenase family)